MSYNLIKHDDPVLHQIAKDIQDIDEKIRYLSSRMFGIMYSNNGVGLAAPQIGVSKRLIVINTSNHEGGIKITLINPVIMIHRNELNDDHIEMIKDKEMCLSCPGVVKEIYRQSKIHVFAQNIDGKLMNFDIEGLTARVVQHEIDHLNGILITDKK